MDQNKKLNLKILPVILFTFLVFKTIFPIKPIYASCEPWCNLATCTPWDDCNECTGCIPGEKPLGSLEGLGPLGTFVKNLTKVDEPISLLNNVISIGIGLITLFSFLYFILQFITAGLKWLTSGGDQKSIEAAQKQITNSLIGLVIVVSAIFIIELVGMILKIELLNPFDFLKGIW